MRDLSCCPPGGYFNVAGPIDGLDDEPLNEPRVVKSYGRRSAHGEAFFALFMNRFGRDGLYIPAEPEAALSPSRQPGL